MDAIGGENEDTFNYFSPPNSSPITNSNNLLTGGNILLSASTYKTT